MHVTKQSDTLNKGAIANLEAARGVVPRTLSLNTVDQQIKEQVNVARLKLMQQFPLEAALLSPMKLAYVADIDQCPTAMTDCHNRIWMSPEFMARLDSDSTMMLLAHEAYHPAMMHGVRRGSRRPDLWNMATDFWINGILQQRGFSFRQFDMMDIAEFERVMALPPDQRPKPDPNTLRGLLEPSASVDITPEQIYDRLLKSVPQPESGGSPADGMAGAGDIRDDLAGVGTGDSDSDGDSESGQTPSASDLNSEMSRRLAQGALAERAHAKQRGGPVDAFTSRLIDDSLQDKVNWKVLVQRMMKKCMARDDYSGRRPSRRGLARGVVTPMLRSEAVECIAAVCDTSGSVCNRELSQYAAEVASIVTTVRAKETHVAFCDTAVRSEQAFKRGERIVFEPSGGGGTDFRPGIEWGENLTKRPSFLVYFTDGYGRFPDKAPPFPVIVVLAGSYGVTRSYVPEWAQVVDID